MANLIVSAFANISNQFKLLPGDKRREAVEQLEKEAKYLKHFLGYPPNLQHAHYGKCLCPGCSSPLEGEDSSSDNDDDGLQDSDSESGDESEEEHDYDAGGNEEEDVKSSAPPDHVLIGNEDKSSIIESPEEESDSQVMEVEMHEGNGGTHSSDHLSEEEEEEESKKRFMQGVGLTLKMSTERDQAEPSSSTLKKNGQYLGSSYAMDPETGSIKCQLCSCSSKQRFFKDCQGFVSHFKTLHLNPHHRCHICGKEFINKGFYKRHCRKAHLKALLRRFKCGLCLKSFFRKLQLAAHQRTFHSSAKRRLHQLQCKFCLHTYSKAANRKRHEQHFCPKRGQTTAAAEEMIPADQHLNPAVPADQLLSKKDKEVTFVQPPASEEPPAEASCECDLCHKRFGSPKSLTTHKRNVHSGRTFQCAYCPRQFSQSSNRNSHMKAKCPARPT